MLLDKVGEAGAEPKALGPLPEWDLRDLYPGRDSPELRRGRSLQGERSTRKRAPLY